MSAPGRDFSLKQLQEVIESHWGFTLPAAVAGAGHAGRPRRPRFARRPADRRRQVALLPGPGGPRGGNHRRHLAAHRPHERPGGRPAAVRHRRRSARQLAVRRASASPSSMDIREGRCRLLFVSPERLVKTDFCRLFAAGRRPHLRHRRGPLHQPLGPRFSPRISPAGPAARALSRASVHAFTATATEQVRQTSCAQLGLKDPGRPGRQLRSAQPHLPRPAAPRRARRRCCEVLDGTTARPASSTASAGPTSMN